MEVDNETKKELSDVEHIRLMTETKGWQLAYAALTNKILDLQNINNVDVTNVDTMVIDLKARKMAAEMLFDWAKSGIYGRIEQAENAKDALIDKPDSDFITR